MVDNLNEPLINKDLIYTALVRLMDYNCTKIWTSAQVFFGNFVVIFYELFFTLTPFNFVLR